MTAQPSRSRTEPLPELPVMRIWIPTLGEISQVAKMMEYNPQPRLMSKNSVARIIEERRLLLEIVHRYRLLALADVETRYSSMLNLWNRLNDEVAHMIQVKNDLEARIEALQGMSGTQPIILDDLR